MLSSNIRVGYFTKPRCGTLVLPEKNAMTSKLQSMLPPTINSNRTKILHFLTPSSHFKKVPPMNSNNSVTPPAPKYFPHPKITSFSACFLFHNAIPQSLAKYHFRDSSIFGEFKTLTFLP